MFSAATTGSAVALARRGWAGLAGKLVTGLLLVNFFADLMMAENGIHNVGIMLFAALLVAAAYVHEFSYYVKYAAVVVLMAGGAALAELTGLHHVRQPATWIVTMDLVLFLGFVAVVGGYAMETLREVALEASAAAAELATINARLNTVSKCVPDTIWSMDLDGNFTYLSPAIERSHGWTVEEALKLSYRDTVTPRQAAHNEVLLAEVMKRTEQRVPDRGSLMVFESEERRKDGSAFWAEISASFIWSEDGRPIGITGVTRDITERKRAEAEREKLSAQLAQAQKMESIGRLAGGVAHDFNNLLTVINGYSEMCLAELRPGDPFQKRLEEIHKAGQRAAGLTSQLLAFSRKQVLQPRTLNLNRVVEGLQSMLERLVGEDVEVQIALCKDGPLVEADPHQLEQVILNLTVNARDAMPDGGRLLIETALKQLDNGDAGVPAELRPGAYVLLAVTDTGMGMDEPTRQRIFEPFFTTKGVGEGTGLGLSMVQGIVAQSGGFINVTSECGQGTVFQIYLPALSRPTAEAAHTDSIAALSGTETILVVEDQANVRRYAVAVLESYGYSVREAATAGEALSIWEREGDGIHLVLTDVVMPLVSGRELVDRLAKLRPGIKSVFMSGHTDSVIAHHGILEADRHFIQKPFSPEELAAKIRSVLDLGGPGATERP